VREDHDDPGGVPHHHKKIEESSNLPQKTGKVPSVRTSIRWIGAKAKAGGTDTYAVLESTA